MELDNRMDGWRDSYNSVIEMESMIRFQILMSIGYRQSKALRESRYKMFQRWFECDIAHWIVSGKSVHS